MILEDRMTGIELLNKFSEDKKRLEKFVDDILYRNGSKIYRALKVKKYRAMRLKPRTILIRDIRYYVAVTMWDNKKKKLLSWNETFYTISQNRSGKKIIIQYSLKNNNCVDILDDNLMLSSNRNIVLDKSYVVIYENHLLNRYRERYLGLGPGEISFEDLAERFMSGRKNETSIIKYSKEFIKDGNKYLKVEIRRGDGIYFGVIEPMGKLRYITYITPEMTTREGQDVIRDTAMKELEGSYEALKSLDLLV